MECVRNGGLRTVCRYVDIIQPELTTWNVYIGRSVIVSDPMRSSGKELSSDGIDLSGLNNEV